MSDSETIRAVLREHIHDASSQWNLGTFGAIAEFMRDPDEPVTTIDEPGRLSATTARGGIGFTRLDEACLFASETAVGTGWSHRVAICLPEAGCTMNRRSVLTELGTDTEALRPEDARDILFDMGLGTLQADICIRTGDPELIGQLREQAGRSLFEPGNPTMAAIVAAGPHRVFLARIGRCEVYQPIPPANGRSPEGPHTHVLPQLLRTSRTHAATEPIPKGLVPCVHFVPAHPAKDMMGHMRAFAPADHARFEDLLARFGSPELLAIKRSARAAIAAGSDPRNFVPPQGRFGRHALRVALRQLAVADAFAPSLKHWSALFDRREDLEDGTMNDPYRH
ncbi:DUF6925 family protein [Bosea thiooxidans]|nr:hypothetical protein [Bosea sp. (in: a-proteobacteria)]